MARARIGRSLGSSLSLSPPLAPTSNPQLLSSNVQIRPVGVCRSVYLHSSHLTPLESLALSRRLTLFSRNRGLACVLLSRGTSRDLTRSAHALTEKGSPSPSDYLLPPSNRPWRGIRHPVPPAEALTTLDSLAELALCTREGAEVPLVFLPEGEISDGGLAMNLLSHYVVANSQTSYRVRNPSRGLSLDPVGSSFVLETFPGAGRMAGVTGLELDQWDCVALGLATHAVGGPTDGREVGDLLEREMENLDSFENQGFLSTPRRTQGEMEFMRREDVDRKEDRVNDKYKNLAVHYLLENVGCVAPVEEEEEEWKEEFMWDEFSRVEPVESWALNLAREFKDAFAEESLEGVMEVLEDFARGERATEDYKYAAEELLRGMKRSAPLALRATDQLLTMAKDKNESLHSCAMREKGVIHKLMMREDYANWSKVGDLVKWKHQSVQQVTQDEVDELFQ